MIAEVPGHLMVCETLTELGQLLLLQYLLRCFRVSRRFHHATPITFPLQRSIRLPVTYSATCFEATTSMRAYLSADLLHREIRYGSI
jgi:hypothetical protein